MALIVSVPDFIYLFRTCMINLHERYVAELGFELAIPQSARYLLRRDDHYQPLIVFIVTFRP